MFMVPVYLLIVAAPVLTMRLLSEEMRSGTIESLMTTPVTEAEVVLGKFAAVLVFAVVMFLPLAAQAVYLGLLGGVDPGLVLAGFLGLMLLTCQYLAIGIFCSALTRAQVAAAISAFVILVGLYSIWFFARDSTAAVAAALRYVSPPWHFVAFSTGVVDTRDIAYFVIATVVFLFLTVKALEVRKWR
jgi:ABC-2 type transport system permease protein